MPPRHRVEAVGGDFFGIHELMIMSAFPSKVVAPWLLRAAILAVLWHILAEGSLDSWVLGIPAIVLGASWSQVHRDRAPAGWSWRGVAAFALYFVIYSILGGVDVMRRAFRPRVDLAPGFLRYPFRLPPGPARLLFANTITLMPGTLSATMDGEAVLVHALDLRTPVADSLRELEDKIGAAIRCPLAEEEGGEGS